MEVGSQTAALTLMNQVFFKLDRFDGTQLQSLEEPDDVPTYRVEDILCVG